MAPLNQAKGQHSKPYGKLHGRLQGKPQGRSLRRPHARRRAGWTHAGIIAFGLTLLGLCITGIVMHFWSAETYLELLGWQIAISRVSTKTHGFLTWLILLLAGRWLWPHVAHSWRRRDLKVTRLLGQLSLSALGALTVTGFWLLYGPADHMAAIKAFHWYVGLSMPALFWAHGWWRKHQA